MQTVCSGSVTNVALNPTVTGTTFTWTAVILNTPTAGTITGFGSGSGASIAQVLTNTEQRQEQFVIQLLLRPTPVQDQLFYS
jgi:hypothetical protein